MDLRVIRDVRETFGHIVCRLVVLVHEQPLAEAVAAVGAAYLVAQQQDRIRILVLNAACNGDGPFIARVECAPIGEFLLTRDDQLPDRIGQVVPINQAEVVVIGTEDVPLGYLLEFLALSRRDVDELIDVADVPHAVPGFHVNPMCRQWWRRLFHTNSPQH